MDLDARKINSKAIREGEWIGKEYGTPITGWDDLCLRVRGIACPQFRLAQAMKAKGLTQQDRAPTGEVLPEVNDRLYAEALNEAILLEWKNLKKGGKILPHSQEAQTRILLDPDYQPFINAIEIAALKVGEIRDQSEKAIEGN